MYSCVRTYCNRSNTIKWGQGIDGDALLTKLKTSGLNTYMSQFDSAESAADVAKIISDADHWTKEDTAKFAKAASGCIIDNKSVTAHEANGVEFKITTTIPRDVSAYDKYTYTVRDQLSEGLTFNNNLTYKYYDASGNDICCRCLVKDLISLIYSVCIRILDNNVINASISSSKYSEC